MELLIFGIRAREFQVTLLSRWLGMLQYGIRALIERVK
jgi:hypothetical protein